MFKKTILRSYTQIQESQQSLGNHYLSESFQGAMANSQIHINTGTIPYDTDPVIRQLENRDLNLNQYRMGMFSPYSRPRSRHYLRQHDTGLYAYSVPVPTQSVTNTSQNPHQYEITTVTRRHGNGGIVNVAPLWSTMDPSCSTDPVACSNPKHDWTEQAHPQLLQAAAYGQTQQSHVQYNCWNYDQWPYTDHSVRSLLSSSQQTVSSPLPKYAEVNRDVIGGMPRPPCHCGLSNMNQRQTHWKDTIRHTDSSYYRSSNDTHALDLSMHPVDLSQDAKCPDAKSTRMTVPKAASRDRSVKTMSPPQAHEQKQIVMAIGKETYQRKKAKHRAKVRTETLSKIVDVMESELHCSICNELFVKAMTLNCSHSFCSLCIKRWIKVRKGHRGCRACVAQVTCPQCRTRVKAKVRSLAVDNYIDKMFEQFPPEMKKSRQELIDARKKDDAAFDESNKEAESEADENDTEEDDDEYHNHIVYEDEDDEEADGRSLQSNFGSSDEEQIEPLDVVIEEYEELVDNNYRSVDDVEVIVLS